jgi:hypothetical protein
VSRTRKVSPEDEELINEYYMEVTEAWPDMFTWEETPFRPSDDVVLLSFEFHFGSNGIDMQRVDIDGTTWYVNMQNAVPQWYRNGKRIGSMTYDEVVNLFSRRRNKT